MANLLTAVRLALSIPVTLGFAYSEFLSGWVVLLLILIACLTDFLDGKVARAKNTDSARGQLFDHSTDFIFVTSGLAGCAFSGLINPYLPVLILIAFSQYVIDSYYLYKQKELRMSFLGRWNGILYFGPLLFLAFSSIKLGKDFEEFMGLAGSIFAWILTGSTLLSIIDRGLAPLRDSE